MSALGFLVVSPAVSIETFTKPTLAIAAAKAGAIGVIDAEFVHDGKLIAEAFAQLVRFAGGGKVGLRFSTGEVKAAVSELQTAPKDAFAIITASFGEFEEKALKAEIATLKKLQFAVIVETIDVAEAKLAEKCGADAVIAKGHESSGRVGDTTSFVLIQQLRREVKLPVWVQGGISLQSPAAFELAGASGVVLDTQVWLCRESAVSPEFKLRLERMDGSETTLLPASGKAHFRAFVPQGVQATRESFAVKSEAEATEVVALGQDACFASTLVKIGGTVCGVIDAIRELTTEHLAVASKTNVLDEGSELAKSHNTRYPVVQGAMTRVSDTADFAHAVAKGGALPFLALSLMRGTDIEKLLKETKEKLGSLPWGVGLLGFVPTELRDEQLAVVDKFRPPFALIAGGRPDQAKAMEDVGTATYLHVPSPVLLKSFIEMGSRRFIFEGKECGGHVGPRSSMVLWQQMIDVMQQAIGPRDDAKAFHVLFAGGIHDDMSAAMVAALAAPLTARGIKVGVLLGTAYLFTKEAVDTGAIVKKFQDEAVKCNETVLLETGPGHSIRCIASPYKRTFDDHRQQLTVQNKSRDEIREELELMNLGRLRIASKGLAKPQTGGGLAEIPAEQQWQEGMYMIGQVAALHDKVTTIEKLHSNVCTDGQKLLATAGTTRDTITEVTHGEPIAIVGMSCQLPQANDVEMYWQNILNKVDAITEIPESHFDWKNYYNPDPLAPDSIVSKWGGFLRDIIFDPSRYGIPPSSLDSIDPMQVLVLEAARLALEDAGYNDRKFPRDKTSVLLANAGHGPITALYSLRSMIGWKLDGLDNESKEWILDEMPGWTEDSFPGYLGNVTAGRVANRLDLKGINFSIDAACASSLAALYVAINDLRSGSSDVVLLGATDTHNQPGDYLSFSKTHALSKDGRCKTFDASADGIVISEGIAMLVLKRLSDAERAGDRIYAVVRGIGGSSDGRDLSLTAPRPDGQALALRRAYADAGVAPASVTLVEAHGTGTVAGDKAEVEALTRVFKESGAKPEQTAIGSVKTNIGHTKATAGLASLIKVAKSLHHRVLPPTINVKKPNPACGFGGEGPFYVSTEARPWVQEGDQPRRAGVSAFGFGGTNFHTVLEEYVSPIDVQEPPAVAAWPTELFVWKASNPQQLLKQLAQTEAGIASARTHLAKASECDTSEKRHLFELASKLHLKLHEDANAETVLAIVAGSLETLEKKLRNAKAHIESNGALDADISYAAKVKREKVAFLFPGQGSQKINMLRDLALYFPELHTTISQFDELSTGRFAKPLSKFIFPTPTFDEETKRNQQTQLTQTDIAQPAIGACDVAMQRLLTSLSIAPDMVAGHSYGEYVALHAAGIISTRDLVELSVQRGRILADCAAKNPGAMAAVSTDVDAVRAAIKDIEGVYLANINTPTQSIISGTTQGIENALAKFKTLNIAATKIPVSAAFHTPLMAGSKEPLGKALAAAKYNEPRIQAWSNTTALPHKRDAIQSKLAEHAVQPVLFAEQLVNMHDAGARLFIEVGPGGVLTGLADATLKGREFTAINLETGRQPLEHFLKVLGKLAANGTAINFRKLFWNRRAQMSAQQNDQPQKKNQLLYRVNSIRMERIDKPKDTTAKATKPQPRQMAALRQAATPTTGVVTRRGDGATERVMLEFQQSMLAMTNRFLETQQNVMLAYLQGGGGKLPEGMTLPQVSATLPLVGGNGLNGNGNGNGNGHNGHNGNGNGNGNGHNGNGHAGSAQAPAQQLFEQIKEIAVEAKEEAPPAVSLVDSLYEIVSERTGYPREMLDPNLDLEADLGIDSIKRVEILNNFRKLLPEAMQEQLESGIEKLAGTKTLQGVIDWINSLETSGAPSATAGSSEGKKAEKAGDVTKLARGIVVTKEIDAVKAANVSFAGEVLLVGPEGELSKALQAALKKAKLSAKTVSAKDAAAANDVGAVIYFEANTSAYFGTIKAVHNHLVAQTLSGKRAAVIAVTQLGGDFAQTDSQKVEIEKLAQQAGLVGLTKTIAKEYPELHVKAIDFEVAAKAEDMAKAVAAELKADDSIVEIGYRGDKRLTLEVKEHAYADIPCDDIPPITPSSVVLVTGGGRGITGEIALDIAKKYQPTFIILGRLPKPAAQESPVTSGLESAKDIKAALIEEQKKAGGNPQLREVEKAFQNLLRERQVRETLSALEAVGAKVKYHSVDVSDEVAFGKFIDSLYENGKIDGVIHGAGIIEDALIKDKTQESFDRVFNTKVKSALTLAKKLRFDSLKFLFLFSSVVGRTGNAGQPDYVAANEAINKIAVRLSETTSARVASLMWGPWQAGMAPPELEQVFARHGWSMIQPQDGRLCFHEEMLRSIREPEVLLVGKLAGVDSNGDLKAGGVLINRSTAVRTGVKAASFSQNVKVNEHVYLKDHQFDGVPVMPMAVALEMMLEATRSFAPEKSIVGVESMDIPAGIVFHTGKKELAIDAKVDDENPNALELAVHAITPAPKVHFKCKALLADAPNAVLTGDYTSRFGTVVPHKFDLAKLPVSDKDIPDARGTYGKWLFHGQTFQGMQSILNIREDGICGVVVGSQPSEFVTTSDGTNYIIDPVLLDSAMQLAGVWARQYKDVTVLPAGFKGLRLFRPVGYAPVKARIFLTETLATELQCDLAIYNENDELAILVEGLGGIASKAFNRFASQATVSV